MLAFKNSAIYLILKNRRDRKVKKLRGILEEFIAQKNKANEVARRRKRELQQMPLDERLQYLLDDDKTLSEAQFENIKEQMTAIV